MVRGFVQMSAEVGSGADGRGEGFIPVATGWRCRLFGPELTRNLIHWADVVCMTVFLVWYFVLRPGAPALSAVSFPAPPLVSTMTGIATAATFLKAFAFPVRATHMLVTQGGLRLLLHPGDSIRGLEQFISWNNIKSVTRVVGADDSTRLLKIRIRKRRVLNIYPNDQIENIARDLRLNVAERLTTTSSQWFMMLPLLQFAAAALAVAVIRESGVQMVALGLTLERVLRVRRAI